MDGNYTPGESRQRDADGGFGLSTAIAHKLMADECHDLPENLIVASVNQYFFATLGTVEDRHAAVDAWAARHHVEAGWNTELGYCARVFIGSSSMMAIAAPVLAEMVA